MTLVQHRGPTHKYSQELAQYTLRQFSMANAVLDDSKKTKLAKLPGVYSRVLTAESLTSVPSSRNDHSPEVKRHARFN
ncbi:hypothetical protein EST38_g837 [Candolleomyces aberdarensis]|uniref:Uncharacterized protein n=1 Tax=Candolleomyces aberdarensis TaxID=2316362 RepID=A0A4Q2E138_9AGAR|nr:hypothetical protein EST38_g837 [Candolleomyces aberdarensis]